VGAGRALCGILSSLTRKRKFTKSASVGRPVGRKVRSAAAVVAGGATGCDKARQLDMFELVCISAPLQDSVPRKKKGSIAKIRTHCNLQRDAAEVEQYEQQRAAHAPEVAAPAIAGASSGTALAETSVPKRARKAPTAYDRQLSRQRKAAWKARQRAAAAAVAGAPADAGQPPPSIAPAMAPVEQQEGQPPTSLGHPCLTDQELGRIVADINRVHITARWAGHGGAAAAGELFHWRVRADIFVALAQQLPPERQLYVIKRIESNLPQEQTAVASA
jgi:hypothetical protein